MKRPALAGIAISIAAAIAALLTLAGCDPEAFLLDVGLVPGMREAAVERCCACLAERAPPDEPGARCPLEDGVENTSCLCEASAAVCEEALLADRSITLVGACVREDGACEGACGDVLAFPSVDAS